MKRELLISLLAINIIACGGESSSKKDPTAKFAENLVSQLPESLKGPTTEASLSESKVKHGDNIKLNSKLTGTVLKDSEIDLIFTAENSGPVLVKLSANTGDLDLAVNQSSSSEIQGSASEGSNEFVIFEAISGEQYTINIEDEDEQLDTKFELKLVRANRASLNLSENEFVVNIDENNRQSCVDIEDGKTTTEDDTAKQAHSNIINWKDGYIKTSLDTRENFTSINDSTAILKVSKSRSVTDDNVKFDLKVQRTLTLTTDFNTGKITGGSVFTFKETGSNGNSITCNGTSTFTGKTVL